MQMLQTWSTIKCQSKGNIDAEIELFSCRSLQALGFMVIALSALEK